MSRRLVSQCPTLSRQSRCQTVGAGACYTVGAGASARRKSGQRGRRRDPCGDRRSVRRSRSRRRDSPARTSQLEGGRLGWRLRLPLMFERIPNGSFGCAELGPHRAVRSSRDSAISRSRTAVSARPVLARPGGCAHHQPSDVRASEIRAVGRLGMTHPPAGRVRLVAVAAIVWSLSFAVIHVAWALGSRVALGGRRVSGVLLAIDIVAIPFCLLWVAWRLRDADHAAPRRAWSGGWRGRPV